MISPSLSFLLLAVIVVLQFGSCRAEQVSFKSTPYLSSGGDLVVDLDVVVSQQMVIVVELFLPGWQWMAKYASQVVSASTSLTLVIPQVSAGTYDIKASVRPVGQEPPNGNPGAAVTDATRQGLVAAVANGASAIVAIRDIQTALVNNALTVSSTVTMPSGQSQLVCVLELFDTNWGWLAKYASQVVTASGDLQLTISSVTAGMYNLKVSLRPVGQEPPNGDPNTAITDATRTSVQLTTALSPSPDSTATPTTQSPVPEPTQAASPVAPILSGSLVDPLATVETVRVWHVLQSLTTNANFIFGQEFPTSFKKQTGLQSKDSFSSDCKDVTGEHPGIFGADLHYIFYKQQSEADVHKAQAARAYQNGAIVSYDFHMYARNSQTYNADGSNSQLAANIVDPNNSNGDRAWFLGQLDTIAAFFKGLGYPVIYRPFHEMTGNWFWWGSNVGPTTYKKLFQLTVTYLKSKGVHNLIYCWAPDKTADFSYYPGDAYVDILGLDAYEPGLVGYYSTSDLLNALGTLTDYAASHGKVACYAEAGARGPSIYNDPGYNFWTKYILQPITSDARAKRIAFVSTWINSNWETPYIPFTGMDQRAVDDFRSFYNSPNTLFLSDVKAMLAAQANTDAAQQGAPMQNADVLVLLDDQTRQDSLMSDTNRRLDENTDTRGSIISALSRPYALENLVGVDFSVADPSNPASTPDRVTAICKHMTDSLLAIAESLGRVSRDRVNCHVKPASRRRDLQSTEEFQVTISPASASGDGSLSSGYIAAIVVGSLAGVVLLVVVGLIAYKLWQPASNEIRYEGV